MVATPLLTLVTDIRTAILLTLLPTIIINLISIFSDRSWRQALRDFWPLPATAVVGSWLGTQVILHTDPEPFRLLLAAIIVLYLVVDRLRGKKVRPRCRATVSLMIATGMIAGVLAGLVNVLVPILIIFALETGVATKLLVPIFNVSFLLSKAGQTAGFVAAGAVTPKLIVTVIPLTIVAIAMLWWGIKIRQRSDVERYKVLLKASLWAVAGLLVGQHFLA